MSEGGREEGRCGQVGKAEGREGGKGWRGEGRGRTGEKIEEALPNQNPDEHSKSILHQQKDFF